MPNWSTTGADGRRRSQRVILSIPVTVTGETSQGPFTEQTQTLVINAHGALIPLSARISQGQKLQLKSATNAQPQACNVVFVGPTVDGRTQFGVEFAAPAPYFWQISFPPEDWTGLPDEPAQPAGSAASTAAGKPQPQKVAKK